jgi:predicted amidohydrolase
LETLLTGLPTETDLALLPEMFSTGFSMNVEKCAEPADGETVRWMKEQSATLQATLAGSMMIRENNQFFNRFLFVHPDGKIDFYNKRHLFSMGGENIHFSPGQERKIIRIKSFRILPQVCYDLRFPVFSRNRGDYDLLVNCANWPAPRREVWQTLLKARAIENQAYVAGVNRTGTDANGINYSGDSCIIDPKGKPMVVAVTKSEQIISAKLSKGSLERFRSNFPALADADDFEMK